MRRQHRYRVTHLVRADYGLGDQPATQQTRHMATDVTAHMSVIPDGSHWASRSPTLALRIEEGECAIGETILFTLETEEAS